MKKITLLGMLLASSSLTLAEQDPLLQTQTSSQAFHQTWEIFSEAIATSLKMTQSSAKSLSDIDALCKNVLDFKIFLSNNQKYKAEFKQIQQNLPNPVSMRELIWHLTQFELEYQQDCMDAEQYMKDLKKLPIE